MLERQVLADALENYESLPDVFGIVDESMFTDTDRCKIWKEICRLYADGSFINAQLLIPTCLSSLQVEIWKNNINASTPSGTIQNAQALRSAAIGRRAYNALLKGLQACTNTAKEEQEIYSVLQEVVQEVQGENPSTGILHISDAVKEADHTIRERKNNPRLERITTGFKFLDSFCNNGWEPGNLVVLAARPSVGKSSVMVHMAKAAANAGKKVLIFTMEMINEEIVNKMLFATDQVTPREIYNGMVPDDALERAEEGIRHLPIYLNDSVNTLPEIVSRITLAVQKGMCDIVFIDYLSRFAEAQDSRVPLTQAIGKITWKLKSIAKRLRIPVVLLCQLNRESVKADRPPQLYDLRDSGAIEQDADIVVMLHAQYETIIKTDILPDGREITRTDVQQQADMWLRKNRQGKRNRAIRIVPNSTYSAFYEDESKCQSEEQF